MSILVEAIYIYHRAKPSESQNRKAYTLSVCEQCPALALQRGPLHDALALSLSLLKHLTGALSTSINKGLVSTEAMQSER